MQSANLPAKGDVMSNKKTWFVTGAGRGMGLDFAKAVLEAGHAVVATGRDSDAVAKAVGKIERAANGKAGRDQAHRG